MKQGLLLAVYVLIWYLLSFTDRALFSGAFLIGKVAKKSCQVTSTILYSSIIDPLTKLLSVETVIHTFLLLVYPAILLSCIVNRLLPRFTKVGSSPRPHRYRYKRCRRLSYGLRRKIFNRWRKCSYTARSKPRHARRILYRWKYFKTENSENRNERKSKTYNDSSKDDNTYSHFFNTCNFKHEPPDTFDDILLKFPTKPPDPNEEIITSSIIWTDTVDVFAICTGTSPSQAPPISPHETTAQEIKSLTTETCPECRCNICANTSKYTASSSFHCIANEHSNIQNIGRPRSPISRFLQSINVLQHYRAIAQITDPTTFASYTKLNPETEQFQSILLEATSLKASIFTYNNKLPFLPSIYVSSKQGELPIVIDTGASYSISPLGSDFDGPIVSASIKSLNQVDGVAVMLEPEQLPGISKTQQEFADVFEHKPTLSQAPV